MPDIYEVHAEFKEFPAATMYCTNFMFVGSRPQDWRLMLYGDNLGQNCAASVYLSTCKSVWVAKDEHVVLNYDGACVAFDAECAPNGCTFNKHS